MVQRRRKSRTHRNLTLAGVNFLGSLQMQNGPWLEEHMNQMNIDEMKELYSQNREVFAALRDPKEKKTLDNHFGHFPGRRSWCWWNYDAPEPRDEKLSEVEQLSKLGLLAAEELQMLDRDAEVPSESRLNMTGV